MHKALLILHLLGFALGLSVPFANIIMAGLIDEAAPAERPILGRFPFRVARLGSIGLVLLWITGPWLLFAKYGGFAGVPWTFHVKLTAVVILTLGVGFIHMHKRRALAGDAAAMARIQLMARVTMAMSLLAMVFAVLTFN